VRLLACDYLFRRLVVTYCAHSKSLTVPLKHFLSVLRRHEEGRVRLVQELLLLLASYCPFKARLYSPTAQAQRRLSAAHARAAPALGA